MAEEPSYMMFARANVRDNYQTPASVVRELLARIDRADAEIANLQGGKSK